MLMSACLHNFYWLVVIVRYFILTKIPRRNFKTIMVHSAYSEKLFCTVWETEWGRSCYSGELPLM